MKKVLLAILAILLLGYGAYYSLKKEETKSTVDGWDTNFSIADTSLITRFFIAQKNGKSHHFVKQPNGEWKVNNKWQSEKKMAELILGTIHEIKLKAPVPKTMRNNIIKELASRGIKVELYNAEGIIKTFYIGESTSDELGTYIIMEGSEQPYIVHIPRLQGFLTSRFTVNKTAWLDKKIFQSPVKKIISLKVDYPNDTENSFHILRDSSGFKINGIDDLNKKELNKYLKFYENREAEQIAKIQDKIGLNDSLSTVIPHAIIEIEDENPEHSNKITLYNIGNEERMLGYLNESDYYVGVQIYSFKNLLVKKAFFEKVKLEL